MEEADRGKEDELKRNVMKLQTLLKTTGNDSKFTTQQSKQDYQQKLCDELRKCSIQLDQFATLRVQNHWWKAIDSTHSFSRDPFTPLYDDPGRQRIPNLTTVEWLASLSQALQHFGLDTYLPFTTQMFIESRNVNKVLKTILGELNGGTSFDERIWWYPPQDLSKMPPDDVIEKIRDDRKRIARQRLFQAVEVFHREGVDPSLAADELVATILYTSHSEGKPLNVKLHGTKLAFFGVTNWSNRVLHDNDIQLTKDELRVLNDTVHIFLPFQLRVDTFLCRLPKIRKTLFRGITLEEISTLYDPGTFVAWCQLSSATEDFEAAKYFGQTMFICHVHTGSSIDFVSVFPCEAEILLPSFSIVLTASRLSPTLLRMLQSRNEYIEVHQIGDQPTEADIVAQVKEKLRCHTDDLLGPFLETFVESSIATLPPPVSPDMLLPLYSEMHKQLNSATLARILLLGEGGIGKTSAALAILCHFNQSSSQMGKKMLVVFVPLPTIQHLRDGHELDRNIRNQVGLREGQMPILFKNFNVAIVLDSLDECGGNVETDVAPLADTSRYCRQSHVIVTCRTEYLEKLLSATKVVSIQETCHTFHVRLVSRSP